MISINLNLKLKLLNYYMIKLHITFYLGEL